MEVSDKLHGTATLHLGKASMVTTEYEDRWAPVQICMLWRSLALPGIGSKVLRGPTCSFMIILATLYQLIY
jgi:hypothetical protein